MDAIVKAIRVRWPHERTQHRHLKAISSVIEFARSDPDLAPSWKEIPGGFAVDPVRHAAKGTESNLATNVDEPFRFVPQPIIDWLMDHLHLIDRGSSYRTAEARMMLFIQERCGRRTGETTRLVDDCISYDDSGAPYLEWALGKAPWGRGKRLPIRQETHDVIRDWQTIKREHGVTSKWLFPSSKGTADRHYDVGYLGQRLNELLARVAESAPFDGAVGGSEGNLVHFDISIIDPYSFRHAFAQRLADATDQDGRSTTPPDVLQDYMGHKSFATTMAYYAVTIAAVARTAGVSREFIHSHENLHTAVITAAKEVRLYHAGDGRPRPPGTDKGTKADRITLLAQISKQRERIEMQSARIADLELQRQKWLGTQLANFDGANPEVLTELRITNERLMVDKSMLKSSAIELRRQNEILQMDLSAARQALTEELTKSSTLGAAVLPFDRAPAR